jgi:hypothetical protein
MDKLITLLRLLKANPNGTPTYSIPEKLCNWLLIAHKLECVDYCIDTQKWLLTHRGKIKSESSKILLDSHKGRLVERTLKNILSGGITSYDSYFPMYHHYEALHKKYERK